MNKYFWLLAVERNHSLSYKCSKANGEKQALILNTEHFLATLLFY